MLYKEQSILTSSVRSLWFSIICLDSFLIRSLGKDHISIVVPYILQSSLYNSRQICNIGVANRIFDWKEKKSAKEILNICWKFENWKFFEFFEIILSRKQICLARWTNDGMDWFWRFRQKIGQTRNLLHRSRRTTLLRIRHLIG